MNEIEKYNAIKELVNDFKDEIWTTSAKNEFIDKIIDIVVNNYNNTWTEKPLQQEVSMVQNVNNQNQ